MKIAQVCPFFYPVLGGMEEHVYRISKNFIKNGNEVYVFTSNSLRKGKIKKFYEVLEGIKIFRFNTILKLGDFGVIYFGFLNYLIKNNFDVIHVHNYRHLHTVLAALLCRFMNKPCVLTTHSPFHQNKLRRNLSRVFVKIYDFFLSKFIDKMFSKIILINSSELRYFKHVDRKKLVVIPNGIDNMFFKKYSKILKRKIMKKYNISKKDYVILFVGRIHPTKGLKFLIDGFSCLNRKNVKLLIVGPVQDGNYFLMLKKTIKERGLENKVIFTGMVSESEKIALYDISKIFILPSIYEPFGIVILEAFARKKPVIAVESDGPNYLIKNGENGFLIKYGDEKALVKYIEVLMKDKKTYNKICSNNIKKVKEFTWEKVAKKIMDVYEEVCKQ